MLFLFCVLEILELGLIASGLNKTEKLEVRLEQDLRAIREITNLLNEHLSGMGLECRKKKR